MFVRHHEIVERHRRQRRGQLAQLVRRRVQPAALVGRADDEHAHVALARRRDRGQVVLEQVVGVQVDVVEPIGRMMSMSRRVGACVEKPMWRMRPARRNSSATSQQPPARRVSSTQLGEFSPWNDSRSMRVDAQQRERLFQLRLERGGIFAGAAASSAARTRCAGGAPAPCRAAPRWCRSRARSRSG